MRTLLHSGTRQNCNSASDACQTVRNFAGTVDKNQQLNPKSRDKAKRYFGSILLFITILFGFSSLASGQMVPDNFGNTASNPLSRTGWTEVSPGGGSGTSNWEIVTSTPNSSGYTGASGQGCVYTTMSGNNVTKTLTYDNNLSTVGYTNLVLSFGGYKNTTSTVPNVTITYSTDGTNFSTFTGNSIGFTNSWALYSVNLPAGAENQTDLRIRFTYVTNNQTGRSIRMDDFSIIGTPSPSLSVTPASLNLGYVINGGTSTEQTYTISGVNLTGAPGNITISAPSNFEVSLTTGSGFGSSVDVPYSSATLASTTIFVRFKPTSANTNYNGNVTNAGGGATTQNVAVSGTSVISYCTSVPQTSSGYITNVTLNTINNTTGVGTYTNYTSTISTNLVIGQTYPITITIVAGGSNRFGWSWIDWNKNGDFTDDGVGYSLGNRNSNGTLTSNITVPAGATLGTTRMRVSLKFNAAPTSCESNQFGEVEDYAIVVVCNSTLTLSSTAGTNEQTVCINDPITNITYTTSADVTGANVTGLPAGVTGSFNAGTVTISGTPTTTTGSPFTYNITTSGGSCTAATATGTITVNASPAITGQPVSPSSVCAGTNSSTFTVVASGAGLNYQWERGISSVYTPISGSTTPNDGATYSNYNSATLTVANATAGMDGYTYRCVVSGTCSPTVTSNGAATLSVNALPTITTDATPAVVTTICQDATIQYTTLAYSASSENPTSFSIDWATITDQGSTSFAFSSGGGEITGIVVPAGTAANTYSGTMTITNANGCTTTQTVTLTVNALPTVSVNSQTVCAGETGTITATPGSGGTYSYAWTVPGGETNPGDVPSFNPTVAGTYSVIITNTSTNCSSASASGVLTVNPVSLGGTATATAPTLCSGSGTTITLTDNTGTIQWQQSANGINSWGPVTGGTGETTATYTTPNLTTTTYYRALVTSGVCASDNSSTASVTIDPAAVGGTATPTEANLCEGNNTTITLTGYAGTIQWQQSANGTTNWADVTGGSGELTDTYTTPNLSSTIYYRAVVSNGVCTPVNSTTAQVTVSPASVGGTATSDDAALCAGISTILRLTGSTGSIQWQQSANGTSGWTDVTGGSGATTAAYTTPALSSTIYYRAEVTSGVCLPATSDVVMVDVTLPAIPGIPTSNGPQCADLGVTLTANGSAPAGETWYWQGTNASGTSTANPASSTYHAASSGTYYIRSQNDAGLCWGSSASIVVTVNPLPVDRTVAAIATTVCTGSGTNITVAASVSGTTYQLRDDADDSPVGSAVAGNGITINLPTGNLTADKTFNVLAETAAGCTLQMTNTPTVTVSQQPTATITTGSHHICINGIYTLTSGEALAPIGSVQWTEDGAGTISAGATTLTPTYSAAPGDAGKTVTLTMTVSNAPCTDATDTYALIVDPLPVALAGGSQTICPGGLATVSGASSANGTIQWTTVNGLGTISAATSLTPTYNSVAGDAALSPIILTLTVTSNNECTPQVATATYSVNVVPTTSVAGPALSMCSDAGTVDITAGSSVSNAVVYVWETSGDGLLSDPYSITNCTYTPGSQDIIDGSVTLTLTAFADPPCTDAISSKTLTIVSPPVANAGTAVITCSNSGAVNITTGASASNYASISWSSSGTGTWTNQTNLTGAQYTPSAVDIAAGSVSITLTAHANTPCSDKTSTKILNINPAPTAVAGSNITTCSNTGVVNITSGASASNAITTTWTSDGDGTFTNPTSLTTCTYVPGPDDIAAGSRTLTLTVTGAVGCANSVSTKTITIVAAPRANAGTAMSVCYFSGAISITAGSSASNNTGITWTSSGTGSFSNANSLTTMYIYTKSIRYPVGRCNSYFDCHR